MINDPIADLLTRMRNANQRKHKSLVIPYSKIKNEILKVILEEGYISDYKIKGSGVKKEIEIFLKYRNKEKIITGLKRISKPGLRVYSSSDKLPIVLNGYGIAIISTSKGIITSQKAKELNLGGEVLAYV